MQDLHSQEGDGSDPFTLEMNRLLVDRLIADAIAELDEPHVVVCTHLGSGASSIQGPYSSALAAAVAAQRDIDGLADLCLDDADGDWDLMQIRIAPLIGVPTEDA